MGDAPGLREYRGAVAFDLKRLVADRFGENYALHEQYVNPTLVDARGEPRLDLFMPDQLHLRPPAYEAFARILKPVLERAYANR